MDDNFYKQLVQEAPTGYAYHKIICKDDDLPYDYEFLEVNIAFERLTGLKGSNIIGRKFTEILSGIREKDFDWINFYGEVAINGGCKEFDQFSEPLQHWYRVKVYSPEKYYFVTLFTDISKEMMQLNDMKKLASISEEFFQLMEKDIDYQKITDDFFHISGANYAAFNLYDANGIDYNTIATAGDIGFKKAVAIIASKIKGKHWDQDPIRAEKIQSSIISKFSSLTELVGEGIPKNIILELEKIFKIGEIIVIRIMKNDLMLGDFTLIMKKGEQFNTDSITEIYSRQLGMVIANKRAEQALRKSEEKYRLITEYASDVIWVINLSKSKYTYISPSILYLRGLTAEEVMNEKFEVSLTPESLEIVTVAIKNNINEFIENPETNNNFIYIIQQVCKNGDIIWVEVSAKYRYNAEGDIEMVGASRNIEERKKSEREVIYLSYHDQLTGLYNRRYYEEELKRLDTERNLPITLIMADVNGLKLTNDAFGHQAGDLLLERVAAILKRECRADEIVSRIGGDEFVILLPKAQEKEAERIIKRLNAAIANEKMENAILSISIGYAVKHHISNDMNEVFKKAEDNMYRHKLSESSNMRSKTIDLIMNSLYENNRGEMLHSIRVSELCEAIANKMGFEKDDINRIKIAGLMHDIGKIGINSSILNKNGKLNRDEFFEIQRHSEIGYRILSSVNEFTEIADYVLSHHERWDGKGYQICLQGEEILLQARIIAIADAYDAMTSGRTYRKALSEDEAIKEIVKCSGKQFDPEIAKIFIEQVLGKVVS